MKLYSQIIFYNQSSRYSAPLTIHVLWYSVPHAADMYVCMYMYVSSLTDKCMYACDHNYVCLYVL